VDAERTLVLVKPDGVARGLVGEVLTRIERKGLRLVALELRTLDQQTARTHYAEHRERPFYEPLVEFITSGPLVAAVVEGPRAVEAFRQLAGATDPIRAAPGSIRGDHALEVQDNVVHGSDSPESAAREIALFFPDLAT
jgi:nucleoside-diphosphate kinase